MWYTLMANLNKRESYIEINGSYDRFYGYFLDLDDNVNLGNITATTQEGLTNKDLSRLDYLDEVRMPNLPIFSKKFFDLMSYNLKEFMTLHPCSITFQNTIFTFYIGRILNVIPMIDYDKSGFRLLTDGSKVLDTPIFIRDDINQDIIIARDIDNETYFFVNNTFKEMVESQNLNIKFLESTYSFW